MDDQKIYIPLEDGELIERFEALRRLNIPIEKLRDRQPEAEENFEILIAMMTEFAMNEMMGAKEAPVGMTSDEIQRHRYHLEEAAQEYLVG